MRKLTSRRALLQTVPLAAMGAAITSHRLSAAPANLASQEQSAAALAPESFKLFTAAQLEEDAHALQAKPGNNWMQNSPALPFAVSMTTEEKKAAKEFEYHEARDHVFQIVDGTTVYEVGGKPLDGRNTKPGEWLAPSSPGSTAITLRKGDMLIVPRNTPHRRRTETSVTLLLITTSGKGVG